MIDIKNVFLDIDSTLKVSDVSKFDSEKLKKATSKFTNMENIVMISMLTDDNKDYFSQSYIIVNYLKYLNFTSSKEVTLNKMQNLIHRVYLENRRKELVDATDNSNLNELNVDFYHDKILESKHKNKKFSFEVIEEPVDLNKELSEEYIQECINSEIKRDKLQEKLVHKIYKDMTVSKYKNLKENYIGIVIYRGLMDFIYEDTTESDIKEMYEFFNKKIDKTNLNQKQ